MNSLKITIGTLFGTGYLPKAPGTWGSLFSLPVIWAIIFYFPVYGLILFVMLTSWLSLWSAPAAEDVFGSDPSEFVMDECAGQAVVFLFTTIYTVQHSDFYVLFAGFLLFRMFDILKPFGINALQNLDGKFGILADDLLAGVYALICLETLKLTIAAIL